MIVTPEARPPCSSTHSINSLPNCSRKCTWNPAAWNAASTDASSIRYGTMPIDGPRVSFPGIHAQDRLQDTWCAL